MKAHRSDTSGTTKNTLYFDGQCPVCTKEMCKLEEISDDNIELVDIHKIPANADATQDQQLNVGPSKEELLKILHLQKPDGSWVRGLDANVMAWQHTKLGWLAKPLRWPLIAQVADWVYYRWAERRYQKKYGDSQ